MARVEEAAVTSPETLREARRRDIRHGNKW